MNLIQPLEATTRADAAWVGSKANTLGDLTRAGFSIPPGFVLTTAAYARFIAQLAERLRTRLTPEIIDDPAELEPASEEVRDWIVAEVWDDELLASLTLALATVPTNSYAARTSLATEELATSFGAGAERAVLGLAGETQLRKGIAACWAALWTSRSIYYRYLKKIPQTSVTLGVLVQPMVRAEAAGVLYTRNRKTGDPSEMEVDSIWGLGAPLTQARVSPDRFYVRAADGAIRERIIEHKPVQLLVTDRGEVEQRAVPDDRVSAPSLSDQAIAELAVIGQKIRDHFQGAQEIEWARAGDRFWILQARPIAMRQS